MPAKSETFWSPSIMLGGYAVSSKLADSWPVDDACDVKESDLTKFGSLNGRSPTIDGNAVYFGDPAKTKIGDVRIIELLLPTCRSILRLRSTMAITLPTSRRAPMNRIVRISTATLVSLWCATAVAQDATVNESRALTHSQALSLATQSNLRLLINGMEREVAEFRATEARRPYVPVLFIEPEFSNSQNLIVDPPRFTTSADLGAGVRWDTRYGTTIDVRAFTSPWYTGFAPAPLTSVQTSLRQSLLRGGWNDSTLLDRTDLGVELQRQVFVGQLNGLLVEVERAYWNLAYAQADIEIKERSKERAQQQFEDTQENIRRGLLAPGDIFVVEENLVIFEEQLLQSREQLQLAQLQLARLLQMPQATDLVATTPLDKTNVQLPTLDAALDTALRQNPEVEAARIAVEQARVQLAYDKNQARPVLDLAASLSLNGLNENQAQAWEETVTARNPALRVGLYFEVPLSGASYRARVERADVERKQQLESLKDVETEASFRVRELLAQLQTRVKSLDFAQRRIDLAEKKLQAERDKYQRGLSTLTDLVRFQRDVDSARISERRARLTLAVLYAQLGEAQGILHRLSGVEVR